LITIDFICLGTGFPAISHMVEDFAKWEQEMKNCYWLSAIYRNICNSAILA